MRNYHFYDSHFTIVYIEINLTFIENLNFLIDLKNVIFRKLIILSLNEFIYQGQKLSLISQQRI